MSRAFHRRRDASDALEPGLSTAGNKAHVHCPHFGSCILALHAVYEETSEFLRLERARSFVGVRVGFYAACGIALFLGWLQVFGYGGAAARSASSEMDHDFRQTWEAPVGFAGIGEPAEGEE